MVLRQREKGLTEGFGGGENWGLLSFRKINGPLQRQDVARAKHSAIFICAVQLNDTVAGSRQGRPRTVSDSGVGEVLLGTGFELTLVVCISADLQHAFKGVPKRSTLFCWPNRLAQLKAFVSNRCVPEALHCRRVRLHRLPERPPLRRRQISQAPHHSQYFFRSSILHVDLL